MHKQMLMAQITNKLAVPPTPISMMYFWLPVPLIKLSIDNDFCGEIGNVESGTPLVVVLLVVVLLLVLVLLLVVVLVVVAINVVVAITEIPDVSVATTLVMVLVVVLVASEVPGSTVGFWAVSTTIAGPCHNPCKLQNS